MTDKELLLTAIEAREKAYAPYSNHKVGAALVGKSGKVYTGCNVENAAYTPTNCAERTAIFKAVSEGEREFVAIAIVGGIGEELSKVCAPCGVCRQVLADKAREQLPRVKAAFDARDSAAFNRESEAYLQLIRDTATILATSEDFLLGRFLEGAEAKGGKNTKARAEMRNAMLQLITTWTPANGMLNDYAHRQFSELMSHYYLKRWEAFFNARKAELKGQAMAGEGGQSATQTTENNGEAVSTSYELSKSVDAVEQNFRKSKYPLYLKRIGSVTRQAERILEKL